MKLHLSHKTPITISVIGALFALLLNIVSTQPATAAQTAPPRRLQVSPVRTEVNIQPGTAYKGSLTLKNTGTNPLTVQLSTEAFSVQDRTYEYTFNPNDISTGWVHFASQTLTINANDSQQVRYVINVPSDAEPGGAYLSLLASSLPDSENPTSIASTDRVGSMIYMTILGNSTQTGTLLSFTSPFAGISDVPWSATIHSTGTNHFTSEYTVALKTLWGTEVSNNTSSTLLMPNSIRLIEDNTPHPQWLGLYVVQYTIPLGSSGEAVGTRPYLYLPIGQTSAVLALLIAATILLQHLRSTRSRKKRP